MTTTEPSYREQAITFDCQGEWLVGVVALPQTPRESVSEDLAPTTGLIIIVGGPQYRAGSHRQFVLQARAVAAAGTPVLRFDYRGMGDSTGDLHTFENVNQDIAAAIDALLAMVPSIENIALWGLCDGASAALLYCHATQDARIKGLCLLNPWVRSDASLAKTQVKHYYIQRLRQKEFWLKLLTGKVAASAVAGLVRNVKAALGGQPNTNKNHNTLPFQTQMALAWKQFKGPILLILSGEDYTAKEFLEFSSQNLAWRSALETANIDRHDLKGADHTFSDSAQFEKTTTLCTVWLNSISTISTQLGATP